MLDLVEKVSLVFCAVIVALTALGYAFIGFPSTTAAIDLPAVQEVAAPAPAAPAAPGEAISPADKAILDKLRENDVKVTSGQALPRKSLKVPEQVFEYISAEANWLPQLKHLQSRPMHTRNGDTRLKIFNIQPESILTKLKFQENDVVELIDGEIVPFTEQATLQYYERFRTTLKKLRQGQPLSVTITRNNQPLHLEFKL